MRAAIDAGTFRIDASAIADKLLSNAQEVLSRMGRHDA
ncbi:anti-sigma-28 factor FlgM [Simplicispira metamorpha]|uniref:Anti-sigma-28 factor FlgM n=2 Tax=Simplicispira TaxID=352450 RepID=A0A4V2SJE6_9BURK|nr:anti-sigma-28 factor FlgM [Simplicispira metamorpha]